MRIISGKARGIRLETLDGDDITRPTAERVKEALFSMIQFELEDTRVLDLFGGSGQLALEALSRGAASAVICDANKSAAEIIRKNTKKAGFIDAVKIFETDYKSLIRTYHSKEKFDIVFLDPPYALKLIPDALDRLVRANMLSAGAVVVCESDQDKPVERDGFKLRRFAKYGKIYITLLEMEVSDNESNDNGEL